METATKEALEELLELLWTADEDKLGPLDPEALPETLRCFVPFLPEGGRHAVESAVALAVGIGLVAADERGRIELTQAGIEAAKPVVRRHRLTESLLEGTLEVSDAAAEQAACQAEHILSDEVTDAVCAFLGHPMMCPHQRAIPRGKCCIERYPGSFPVIVRLDRLSIGEEARVAFIHTRRHNYLQRLNLMGVVPGTRVRVHRIRPALVIQVGETELAMDQAAGTEIFVRRSARRASAAVGS